MTMSILVQKFGGTSVADGEKIASAANKVLLAKQQGYFPVVVVSAMAGVTNQLITNALEAKSINDSQSKAEYDALLANGENITAALMSLALQNLGLEARSLQAWQVPIKTNSNFANSFIEEIPTELLQSLLDKGIIPVIAGFQGLENNGRLTTLGRGGSDITAVAIAASIGANRCDIYTDVAGIFTADPRFVPNAQKIDYIDYEAMLEFSILGAKVLHYRAVEIAMKYNVAIKVLSSFDQAAGTDIAQYKENNMEQIKLTGIAHNDKIALVELAASSKAMTADLVSALLEKNINVISILSFDDKVALIVSLIDLIQVKEILTDCKIIYKVHTEIALVSLVGIGINNDLRIVHKVLTFISNAQHLNVSTTKISFIVKLPDLEAVIKILHAQLFEYL